MPPDEKLPAVSDAQVRWSLGQEDPLRLIRRDGDDRGHPLQYAVIGHPHPWLVVGTGNATDEQIRAILPPGSSGLPVERFNRCPTCEEWSPCGVRTAWREKIPVEATAEPDPKVDDAGAEHRARVEVTAEPDDGEPLATAWQAWRSAQRYGATGVQAVEATQAAALLSIAESLAALGPAVSAVAAAVAPGVVGATTNAAAAFLDALKAQTEAIRAIGERLEILAHPMMVIEPLADAEERDFDGLADRQQHARWLTVPPTDVNTMHAAERLRMRLERIRELVEERIETTNWMSAQEILAILDEDQAADPPRRRLERIRELCDARQADSVGGGRCDVAEIWPSEILAVLDEDRTVPDA